MDIQVCIGSSCHVKGAYGVINEFNALVAENHLENKVKVQAAFCLGLCKDGVTIKIGESIITGVNKENVHQVFDKYVLGGVM